MTPLLKLDSGLLVSGRLVSGRLVSGRLVSGRLAIAAGVMMPARYHRSSSA